MNRQLITRLLGIRTPVIAPPMAGASGGALAAQATNGGGFGFISAGYHPVEFLVSELSVARSLLESKTSDKGTLPIGVGYIAWVLEKYPSKDSEALISAALDANVQALWFAFGDDMGRWIRYVRENAPKGKAPLIFVQVNSVDEAVNAVEQLKADVIVAQGIESGGHGGNYAPPLSDLLQTILARFSGSPQAPVVLAAGGLANGIDVASHIARGASGAVMGTRFLLTPESKYTNAQREALLAAGSEDTIRSMAFDYARDALGWPEGVDGRGLRNDTVADFEQGVDLELIRAKYKEAMQNQDRKRLLVWAGTGVGSMNRIMPARDVMEDLQRELEYQSKHDVNPSARLQ